MTDSLDNPALKEWAVIWRAVADGRQIIDLRKGGLREQAHRFRVRASRFWLYDSFEHQRRELLRPGAGRLLDATVDAQPPADRLRFVAWAEIAAAASITEPDQLAALDGEFIWTPDYAAQRLNWRPRQPLWLLLVRAYRLRDPIEVPRRPEYAGCASWVPMRDLPPDPTGVAADPVLDPAVLEDRLAAIREAVPTVTFETDPAAFVETD